MKYYFACKFNFMIIYKPILLEDINIHIESESLSLAAIPVNTVAKEDPVTVPVLAILYI